MKKFFTQPIGDLSRQNALTFLVINVVFIGVEFSGVTALDAVDDLLNFFWGFSLIAIITAGYYLAEGHVPEYWQPATTVLATVIIFGTFLEILEFEEGFFIPMYFFWAFNSLIYTLTLRGTGIFRPIYEYITLFSSNVHFLPMGIIKSQYYGHRHNPNCNPRCSPIDVVISDGAVSYTHLTLPTILLV